MKNIVPQSGTIAGETKPVPVMAVKKALDLLCILAFEDTHRQGLRLSDLAGRLGMLPNTTRNLLKTMIVCGFVSQTEHARYVVGPVTMRLGMVNRLATENATTVVTTRLRELAARFAEGVVFAILSDGQRAILAEADSSHQVRIVRESRESRNFFSYPTGRVLAAYASESDLARIVARHGMPGGAWDGIATPAALARALAGLRQDGFCALQEPGSQVLGLAVPAVDRDGALLGALGLHAPAFRCPAGRRNEILRALRTAAAELAENL